MKTRRSVRKMKNMMHHLNPGLVRALIDERDQVPHRCMMVAAIHSMAGP